MTLQAISGLGQLLWYGPELLHCSPAFGNTTALAATGDKFAMSGYVYIPGGGTKNITRLWFRFGSAITKAGGSALTLSLQDPSTSAGPVMQPDGTQDQTVAIANGSIAASTGLRTGALNATRSVTSGDPLSVVIEYDGAGRLGADSITFTTINAAAATETGQFCVPASFASAAWAVSNTIADLALEFDDGTFGTLFGAIPILTINTHAFKQDTAVSDEYALAFQVPFSCKVDGVILPMIFAANTSDCSIILYDGTSAMTNGTIALDANRISAAAVRFGFVPFSQPITLTINHQYYLALQPTQTTSTVTIYTFDVADANHLVCHPGGTLFNHTTRVDANAWAAITTTRRLFAGLHISHLDDGVGGGLQVHPGMTGGMRG